MQGLQGRPIQARQQNPNEMSKGLGTFNVSGMGARPAPSAAGSSQKGKTTSKSKVTKHRSNQKVTVPTPAPKPKKSEQKVTGTIQTRPVQRLPTMNKIQLVKRPLAQGQVISQSETQLPDVTQDKQHFEPSETTEVRKYKAQILKDKQALQNIRIAKEQSDIDVDVSLRSMSGFTSQASSFARDSTQFDNTTDFGRDDDTETQSSSPLQRNKTIVQSAKDIDDINPVVDINEPLRQPQVITLINMDSEPSSTASNANPKDERIIYDSSRLKMVNILCESSIQDCKDTEKDIEEINMTAKKISGASQQFEEQYQRATQMGKRKDKFDKPIQDDSELMETLNKFQQGLLND